MPSALTTAKPSGKGEETDCPSPPGSGQLDFINFDRDVNGKMVPDRIPSIALGAEAQRANFFTAS
jgi:hypothetical protein